MLRRDYGLMKYKDSSSFYHHNFSIAETCLKLLKIAKRLKKKSSYKNAVIIVLKIHRFSKEFLELNFWFPSFNILINTRKAIIYSIYNKMMNDSMCFQTPLDWSMRWSIVSRVSSALDARPTISFTTLLAELRGLLPFFR